METAGLARRPTERRGEAGSGGGGVGAGHGGGAGREEEAPPPEGGQSGVLGEELSGSETTDTKSSAGRFPSKLGFKVLQLRSERAQFRREANGGLAKKII